MNKKPSKKTSFKRRAASSTKSIAKLKQTITAQAQEIREATEQQAATSEILRVIASAATDIQPVLDVIVESAARVCGVDRLVLRLREGSAMVPRAHFGPAPITRPEISADEPPHFRWMRERGTLHIPDVRAQNEFREVSSVGS